LPEKQINMPFISRKTCMIRIRREMLLGKLKHILV